MAHNRWFVVFGAMLIQISLGAIYIYSVFKPGLKNHFPQWSATDLALPAQVLLACGALGMALAGKIQDRIGPKKTAVGGAFLLLAGMYVAAKAQNLAQFVLGFGVISGIGIFTVYVCPIAACAKWFPDKRGLITGLAVAGFGAGGLVFAPLASYFIAHIGIMATFFYLGAVYFFTIIIGAQFMNVPPAGYRPAGWTPPLQTGAPGLSKGDHSTQEMVKTGRFWILWATYFIGAAAGLMVIMNIANIWQSAGLLNRSGGANLVSVNNLGAILRAGVLAVMVAAICNSIGRIFWGRVSDSAGRERTLAAIFMLCGMSLLFLYRLADFWAFMIGVSAVGFCFGGFLALYPAITADYFGTKNIGANYGMMFTAYGAGGLLGPWLAPKLISDIQKIPYEAVDAGGSLIAKTIEAGSYAGSFFLAGILCFIAAFMILGLAKQKKAVALAAPN